MFGAPLAGFRAFLDGTQRSGVAGYLRGVPIVVGTAAAVVRERRNRRMHTWHPRSSRRASTRPRDAVGARAGSRWRRSIASRLVDTTDGEAEAGAHPFALRDAAVSPRPGASRGARAAPGRAVVHGGERPAVHRRRDQRQRGGGRVVVHGGRREEPPHAVRGGRGAGRRARRSATASGRASSASRRRGAPRWRAGICACAIRAVTIRCGGSCASRSRTRRRRTWTAIGDRADEVSRWILAEASPLALPDARWDKMVYGVRDCEEFLQRRRVS